MMVLFSWARLIRGPISMVPGILVSLMFVLLVHQRSL